MTYVVLQPSHYPLLARHYVETYNAAPWNDRWTEALALDKLSEMMDCRGAFGLVCFDNNGNFCGAILGNPETYFNCQHFFIRDFFVPPALQGKGIGSQIMAAFETRLASMGIDKVYLFTSRGERTEGFYNKKGFRIWENMVLMGKSI